MKEAMRRIDKTGRYCFSDASVGQPSLFQFDNPKEHSTTLFEEFSGKKATYAELRDFALDESPFINPKSMLRDLELNKDLIDEVKSRDTKRRKGTFNEDKLVYVKFKGERRHG